VQRPGALPGADTRDVLSMFGFTEAAAEALITSGAAR
jgi:crotonobetainyl-CoA:carnitine CoA-transferase CaiB-like acyl-CoA transferase